MAFEKLCTAVISAAFETASILGMEIVMFAVAALIYGVMCAWMPKKKPVKELPLEPADEKSPRSSDGPKLRNRSSPRSFPTGGTKSNNNGDLQQHVAQIKSLVRDRDLSGAETVFSRLRESGVAHNAVMFNCFLDACVQCGDLERAKLHFEDMKQLNLVDVVGYNTILKGHLSRGLTKEACSLVKEMAAKGVQANSITYNELLNAKVVAKDRWGMWGVVGEMTAAGIPVNVVTCSILLKSLTMRSNPAEVRRIMDLIDKVDETIDEVLFSSLIEACVCIKHYDLLLDVMRRYRDKGGFANLKVPTYGSMIKAFGQAGDVKCVRDLWREMEEHDMKPTSITLGCMVEALVVNGCADEAWDLIQKTLENDDLCKCVNTVIYSTALKGFLVTRRIDKVFMVYKEMRSKSISCNTITYNTIFDACAKCSAMHHASSLLEDMKLTKIEPDIITYSTLIKGYCLEGDVDRAFRILAEMKREEKLVPDEIMYNSILDGCAKQHRVEEALRILDEMKAAGTNPSNYTLSILVKLLGHARRLNQAFQMVEDLSKQNGFRPNVQVYTCLMHACILNRRLDRAVALHDTMVSTSESVADKKLYAVLVRGCLQLHQSMKAVEVVRAACNLPGHSLAVPKGKMRAVGVETSTLDELSARLQSGGTDERKALASLSEDLWTRCGIRCGSGAPASGRSGSGPEPPWRGRVGSGSSGSGGK